MDSVVPNLRQRVTRVGVVEATPFGLVLVVEDEPDVAELIRHNLAKEGWDVRLSGSGLDALRQAMQERPRVIVLHTMVPGVNGLEVCRRLKRDPKTAGIAIIVVTGRTDEDEKILAFELGADDCLAKPFAPWELLARIRAVARRGTHADPHEGDPPPLKAGDLEMDRPRFEVKVNGRAVDVTRREFELLAALVGSPGRVFGRDELRDLVWGRDDAVELRSVDVHVARLRRKLTSAALDPARIDTVRGVGYRFRDPDRDEAGEMETLRPAGVDSRRGTGVQSIADASHPRQEIRT